METLVGVKTKTFLLSVAQACALGRRAALTCTCFHHVQEMKVSSCPTQLTLLTKEMLFCMMTLIVVFGGQKPSCQTPKQKSGKFRNMVAGAELQSVFPVLRRH